jgi:hypothetical protein
VEAAGAVEGLAGEVLAAEQQIRGWRPVEAEAALARRVERDKGQRRLGLVGADDAVGGHAGRGQAVQQEVTKHVLAEHAGKMAVSTQPRRGDRDVGRGAAGVLQERPRSFRSGRRLGE